MFGISSSILEVVLARNSVALPAASIRSSVLFTNSVTLCKSSVTFIVTLRDSVKLPKVSSKVMFPKVPSVKLVTVSVKFSKSGRSIKSVTFLAKISYASPRKSLKASSKRSWLSLCQSTSSLRSLLISI